MAEEIKLPFKIVLTGLDAFDQVKQQLKDHIKLAESLGRTMSAVTGSRWSSNTPSQGTFDFHKNLYSLRQLSVPTPPGTQAWQGAHTFGLGLNKGLLSSGEQSRAVVENWKQSLLKVRGGGLGDAAWLDSLQRGATMGNLGTVLLSSFGEAVGKLPGVFESGMNKAIPILKKSFTALAGFALAAFKNIAEGFKNFVVTPLVKFFTTEIKAVISDTNKFMAGSFVGALPELIRKGFKEANGEINRTANLILEASVKGVMLPNHATKLAFEYNKVAETLKGFSGWLDRISLGSVLLGANAEKIGSLSLGWAKAFGLDVSAEVKGIAEDMVIMASAAGGTLQDVELISTWLMPRFAAAAGDARDNLRELNALAQSLSEKNIIAPMQVRDLASVFGKLTTPDAKFLAMMSSYNVSLFDTSTGAAGVQAAMRGLGKEYREITKDINDLEKSQVGKSFADPDYIAKHDLLSKKLEKITLEMDGNFKVWEKSGARLKGPLEVLKEIGTVMDHLGKSTVEWSEFEKGLGITPGKNIVALALDAVKRSEELLELVNKGGADAGSLWDNLFGQALEQPEILGKVVQSMIEGLKISIGRAIGSSGISTTVLTTLYKGFKEFFDSLNDPNSQMFKAFANFGTSIKNILETVLIPAFNGIKDIFLGLFSGDAKKVAEAKTKLSAVFNELFSNIKETFLPIARDIGNSLGENIVKGILESVRDWAIGQDPKVQEQLKKTWDIGPGGKLNPLNWPGGIAKSAWEAPGAAGRALLINAVNSGLNGFDTNTAYEPLKRLPSVIPGETENKVYLSDDRELRVATQRAIESKKKSTQAVIDFLNECEAHDKKIIERERTRGTQ